MGGRRIAERRPRSRAPLALAAVAVAAILVTVAAAALWPQPAETPERAAGGNPSPSASSSDARLDLQNLPIPRALDCSALDDQAVRLAVAGPVDRRDSYRNGDRVEVAPGVRDIAHEDGCVFGNTDAEARVWVFAAPVGTAEARRLVRDARRNGCGHPDVTTGFGSPDLVDLCRSRLGDGGPRAVVATLRGLFGDAWLSCQVADSAAPGTEDVVSRAEQWCVHVATTLGARP